MKIKTENYNKGRYGEDMAKNYLLERGYEFIGANFEIDIGEIDLIMAKDGWLVFVEVKYKSDDRLGRPEEMIGPAKIYQVKRVAEFYLMKNSEIKRHFQKWRMDAVCILGSEIKHYENL